MWFALGYGERVSNQLKARKLAERYEREVADHPSERAEILLEAAGQWQLAGEPERALHIYDQVIASTSDESAQYAAVGRLDTSVALGRGDDIDAELERLARTHMEPGGDSKGAVRRPD
ncbi:hypothetical protein ACWEO2_25085 [Nocardia sp. NPDC004278]